MRVSPPPRICGLLVLTALAVTTGCNAPIGVSEDMATVWVPQADPPTAFDAMEATLREQGFQIAERDPVRGYVRSDPIESVIAGGTGRISDEVLKPRNAIRRIAEAVITGADGGVNVRYRVSVERLDTAEVRAWQREHQVSDTPTETPIDQDQATLPEQNETWTPIRRDAQIESAIRLALLERLGRAGESASP
jgi:hypothetical protein